MQGFSTKHLPGARLDDHVFSRILIRFIDRYA
jgi:hypothetical protein